MDSQEQFLELIDQVKQGCPDAQEQLFREYEKYVRYVIRPQLSQPLRQVYDSADFAQAVWASFFSDDLGQRVFASPNALLQFLKRMAKNKVADCYRERRRQRTGSCADDKPGATTISHIPGSDETPSQICMAKEQFHSVFQNQPPHHQRILHLLRIGYSIKEIAAQENICERQLERIVRAIFRAIDRHQ